MRAPCATLREKEAKKGRKRRGKGRYNSTEIIANEEERGKRKK